ncbi:hypothetical protein BC940DRAFT_303708 [Gongronella butleri]|nr:hypothetical protein BC940DRAFT_303708 [Gongronella butleri]
MSLQRNLFYTAITGTRDCFQLLEACHFLHWDRKPENEGSVSYTESSSGGKVTYNIRVKKTGKQVRVVTLGDVFFALYEEDGSTIFKNTNMEQLCIEADGMAEILVLEPQQSVVMEQEGLLRPGLEIYYAVDHPQRLRSKQPRSSENNYEFPLSIQYAYSESTAGKHVSTLPPKQQQSTNTKTQPKPTSKPQKQPKSSEGCCIIL